KLARTAEISGVTKPPLLDSILSGGRPSNARLDICRCVPNEPCRPDSDTPYVRPHACGCCARWSAAQRRCGRSCKRQFPELGAGTGTRHRSRTPVSRNRPDPGILAAFGAMAERGRRQCGLAGKLFTARWPITPFGVY